MLARVTPEEAAALRAQLAASETARALLEARVREMQTQHEALLHALQERYETLLERLRTDSRSSSKPPSSDGPGAAPRSRPPTGKKRGAQKGHKGHSRFAALPADALVELVPARCRVCDHALLGTDPRPVVHQLVDLEDGGRLVTDYRRHRLRCTACQRKTRAPLPEGMGRSPFGPRLRVWLALLPPRFRLGRREVAMLALETFGVAISVGTLSKYERVLSDAVLPAVEAVQAHVEKAPVAYVDETPLRYAGKRGTLWAACTPTAVLFRHAKSRGRAPFGALLGAFSGVLVSDRYGVYWRWAYDRHQYCWAHLVRGLLWLTICSSKAAKTLGEKLLAAARTVLHAWNEVLRGTLARAAFDADLAAHTRDFGTLLYEGTKLRHKRAASLCRGMQYDEPSFWTFTTQADVEPTNNRAERSLRAAVRWRRVSLGTQSERGSRFAERMLTVCETLCLQGRLLVPWLTQCLRAKLGVPGVSVPAVLPATA